MKSIKVDVKELREILLKNRKEHQTIFDEAVEGYKKAREKQLSQELADIKSGKIGVYYQALPVPTNQIKDYDRAIKVLDLHRDKHIELDEDDVACYVQDEWHWTRQFAMSNTPYSATAAGKFGA